MKTFYVNLVQNNGIIELLDEKGIDWEVTKWGDTDMVYFDLYNDRAYNSLMGEYFDIVLNKRYNLVTI